MRPDPTAIVTGAYGNIGRHVARTLAAEGYRVLGLGHGEWNGDAPAAWGLSAWSSASVGLDSLRALRVRPTVLVHCGGSGSVATSLDAPLQDFERTVTATAEVLEYVRSDCPDCALVYPSSAAVYGVAQSFPIPEDAAFAPVSPYGMHKKMAEELVAGYGRVFGLRVAVVRLFSIYGEGFRKQLLWDACCRIARGDAEFFGTGDETRDWLHVDDAARLLVLAARHASPMCPIVNGGSGDRVSVNAVLSELFAAMGRHDGPRFRGVQRPGDPVHYQADTRRARAWGFVPRVALPDGLQAYARWFRDVRGRA